MRFIRTAGAQYALWVGILVFVFALKQVYGCYSRDESGSLVANPDQLHFSIFIAAFGAGLAILSYIFERQLASTRTSESQWNDSLRRLRELSRRKP